MGLYEDRILPRILNRACGAQTLEPVRRRVCQGLAGDMVEIGFGSGLNIPFYPAAVTSVAAVEPCDVSRRLAGERLRASNVPVLRSGLDGQSLPFDDNSFDAALSTWTLCSNPRRCRRTLRAAARPQVRRDSAVPRTWARPGRRRTALAATPRPGATADRRWMPLDPAHRGPARGRGLHGQGRRCLLRGWHHKGLGCGFPRHRILSLVPASRATVAMADWDETASVGMTTSCMIDGGWRAQ